jgi:hypothetical protein
MRGIVFHAGRTHASGLFVVGNGRPHSAAPGNYTEHKMLPIEEDKLKSMMPISSRLIFTALGILLPLGSHLADYNETHIFNPRWTPHAKFHGGQTLMFSILLGALSVFFAWRKTTDRPNLVFAASGFAALYWLTQAGAILYPGTAAFDPEFVTKNSYFLGLAQQNYIEIVYLLFVGLAAWLALKPNAGWTE